MTGFVAFVATLVLATAYTGSTLDQGHIGLIVGWGCVSLIVTGFPPVLPVLIPIAVAIILNNDYGVTNFWTYCTGLVGGFLMAAILNGLRPKRSTEENRP